MPCLYKNTLYYFVVYSGCCPRAPSHYRKQCSLLIGEAFWHSPKSNITASDQNIILYYVFWYHTGKAQRVLIFETAIYGDWWVTRKNAVCPQLIAHLSNRLKSLWRVRQYHCRTLCKFSKSIIQLKWMLLANGIYIRFIVLTVPIGKWNPVDFIIR